MQLTCRASESVPIVDAAYTFRLGCRQYLTRPIGFKRHPADINGTEESDGASLATCFRVQENRTIDADCLRAWRCDYLDEDDVFHPAFLQEIIFGGIDNVHLESDAQNVLESWGTLKVSSIPHSSIPNGPCCVFKDVVHSVWRVYEDRRLAFLQATWPSIEDKRQINLSNGMRKIAITRISTYVETNAAGNGYRGHGIAVPARSAAQDFGSPIHHDYGNSNSPLKGIRVAVKDNYHLRGTRTSLGNRAYYESNPIQNVTAAIVSCLVDAGAHIVGKAHLSAFGMMEHPMQSVDYQAPGNSRGDGYLIAGGSSGGNAVAVAA